MAILPMKCINIYALLKDRKQILELLQRSGTVQVENNLREDELFEKKDLTEEKSKLESEMKIVLEAISILNYHSPEEKSMLASLKGRNEISLVSFEKLTNQYHEIYQTATHIKNLDRQIAEATASLHKLQMQIDAISPWSSLDISNRKQKCHGLHESVAFTTLCITYST
jgi:V/A-type H+-transporting ATPase subunit I